jgi:hypothetical protein
MKVKYKLIITYTSPFSVAQNHYQVKSLSIPYIPQSKPLSQDLRCNFRLHYTNHMILEDYSLGLTLGMKMLLRFFQVLRP